MECKCGGTVTRGVCTRCGNIYDVEIKVTYNEQKTLEGVKQYIVDTSSVKGFSSWKDYYDFEYAGRETLRAYANDAMMHKNQVKEFLEGYSSYELLMLKEKFSESTPFNIANSILSHLDYEYKEN